VRVAVFGKEENPGKAKNSKRISLLEDRFQLKSHVENRELPIYDLVVAKDALELQLEEPMITCMERRQ
jgi:uncharacterized protein (TIGR03435 family)